MWGDSTRRPSCVVVALGLIAALAAGCSSDPVEPVTADPWVEGGLPERCAGRGGDDAEFWDLVHSSCVVAHDGDVEQAEALRHALEEVPEEGLAGFQRTFVRANHSLRVVSDVADDLCAPGLGLGDDLGADFRSWVIAHGQASYEAALADPEVLREFPDVSAGCGLGEPFGAVAYDLYLERTGLTPDEVDLPTVEDR